MRGGARAVRSPVSYLLNCFCNRIEAMKTFHKTETWLSIFSFVSVIIIILDYLLPARNDLLNLLTQFAIGYIINVIFYLTQIYFPKRKEQKEYRLILENKINEIGSRILSHFYQPLSKTVNTQNSKLNSSFSSLEDKDFIAMANYPIIAQIMSYRLSPSPHAVTLIQAMCDSINETKNGIESLRLYFPSLPIEILNQFTTFDNLVLKVKSIISILNCDTMKDN